MGIFSRTKSKKNESDQDTGEQEAAVKREPRKARPWFQRAEDVSATNHDYAIECFINGFKHDPDNMNMHEALREVALKRKVSGGKPAGFMEGMKSGGSHPIDKMIHAERLLAMDPMNVKAARDVMKYAVAADPVEPDFNLNEVALWVGRLAMELNSQAKKPDKNIFMEVCELFRTIEEYPSAIIAARKAVNLAPDNSDLMSFLKDLEAEAYSYKQRGAAAQVEEGHFRQNVKNADEQAAVQQDEAITRTERMINEAIERRRQEYEEDPADPDRAVKLVDALLKKPEKAAEDEGIALLKKVHEQTGQYRYRVRFTDIQMRQMNRIVKQLKEAFASAPESEKETAKNNYDEALRRQLQFELKEYKERVDNYPTDMALRFEYGRRLFAVGKIDEAISQFQQAKSDPKHRAQAHWYLAQCYLKQEWYEEAVSTVRKGIEMHPTQDDRIGLELRYLLMDSLAGVAEHKKDADMAREAQDVASGILQTNINFKDIKDRMNAIRKLTDELQAAAKA